MALAILADENIPKASAVLSELGTVSTFSGPCIPARDLGAADVLLVRSVTRVGEDLLKGTRIRFVGSATTGTDHVDTGALRRLGIAFAHAPGSNAESVVEYVIAAMLLVASRKKESLSGKCLGIVGCGNVGGRLAARAPALGLQVLKCDPLLDTPAVSEYVSLGLLLEASDIVSVHVPLTCGGRHPTHRMLDAAKLRRLKKNAWLINTSRGAVVDGSALLASLKRGQRDGAVLDVWENEPSPDVALVRACTIATPHIAGHSFDGKIAGTMVLHQAIVHNFGLEPIRDPSSKLAESPGEELEVQAPQHTGSDTEWLHGVVKQVYDLNADSERMRALATLPAECRAHYFRAMRRKYPRRRTFRLHHMKRESIPGALVPAVKSGLRIALR